MVITFYLSTGLYLTDFVFEIVLLSWWEKSRDYNIYDLFPKINDNMIFYKITVIKPIKV